LGAVDQHEGAVFVGNFSDVFNVVDDAAYVADLAKAGKLVCLENLAQIRHV
jgi:hypothetical protein